MKKYIKKILFIIRKGYYIIHAIILTPVTEYRFDKPIYIFNHIPKCGGTTILSLLDKWFDVRRDYPPHDVKFPDPILLRIKMENHIANPHNILEFKPWQILAGHYHDKGIHLNQRYRNQVNESRLRLITFLRDPLEHRLSLYYYATKRGHKWIEGLTLEKFIETPYHRNYFARSLQLDDGNYKKELSKYYFIGIVEEFDNSIMQLSNLIKRPMPRIIPKLNRTERKSGRESIDIVYFKRLNALDYKIYEYAKQLLASN